MYLQAHLRLEGILGFTTSDYRVVQNVYMVVDLPFLCLRECRARVQSDYQPYYTRKYVDRL